MHQSRQRYIRRKETLNQAKRREMNTHGATIIVMWNWVMISGNGTMCDTFPDDFFPFIRLRCVHIGAHLSLRHMVDLPARKQSLTSHMIEVSHLRRGALKRPDLY
jgi:hypothetical protein